MTNSAKVDLKKSPKKQSLMYAAANSSIKTQIVEGEAKIGLDDTMPEKVDLTSQK